MLDLKLHKLFSQRVTLRDQEILVSFTHVLIFYDSTRLQLDQHNMNSQFQHLMKNYNLSYLIDDTQLLYTQ